MNDKTKKSGLAGAIGLACIMFGAQFGPAVASGTAISAYNLQAGWLGVFLPLLPMIALAWIGYWGVEVARLTGQTGLVALITELFYPYDKVAGVVWDIGTLLLFPVVLGSAISGCGTVVQQVSGMPYGVSLLITVIVFLLIGIFGRAVLAKLSTLETVICLLIALIFCIICFRPGWEGFLTAMEANDLGPATGRGIWLVIMGIFIATQTISVGIASAGNVLRSKRDTKVAVFTFAILYGLFQMLLGVCFFRLWPDIVQSSIPTLDIATASGNGFLSVAYPIMLLAAFLSTGPVFLFSLSDRWAKAGFWNKLKDTSVLKTKFNARFVLMLVLVLAFSTSIALMGFRFIMVNVIPKQWIFYCVMLAVPMGIIAPFRVSKMRRELAETGHIATAAEKRAAKLNGER